MKIILFLGLLLWSCSSHANGALSPDEVLESARLHYPRILAAMQEQQVSRARIQEKEGAFDATLEQDVSSRLSGFYDGQQIDTRLVKPIPDFNSRVYGGYRISDGDFPIYEDRLITNDNGEILIGAELSLLRNSLIDDRRAEVNLAQIKAEMADIDLLIMQMNVQLSALNRYWRWVAAGKELGVLHSILKLMEDRQDGLEKRYKRGDVAKIFLTENQQYITQRKAQIVEAERAFQDAAFQLSLFYRDSDGEQITPLPGSLPKAFPSPGELAEEEALRTIIAQHPELQRLAQSVLETEQELALGENLLLPKADLAFEFSDDFGSGSTTRERAESVVKLKVSVPLERNLAKGKIRKAKADFKRLNHLAELREDELLTQLANIMVEIKARKKSIKLIEDEIRFAKTMEKAERKRFRAGGSDFFLINVRETALANARIKHVQANTQYQLARAKLDALTLNMGTSTLTPPTALNDDVASAVD
jgi:outer membrane protein TolC